MMRRLVIIPLMVLLTVTPAVAKNVWHSGKITYKHSLAPVEHGVIPSDTHLVLDDGRDIDVSKLQPGDVFLKLVDYWSKERTDYRAAPPFVDQFFFRALSNGRIEVRYTANDMYGHAWKGTSEAIKEGEASGPNFDYGIEDDPHLKLQIGSVLSIRARRLGTPGNQVFAL